MVTIIYYYYYYYYYYYFCFFTHGINKLSKKLRCYAKKLEWQLVLLLGKAVT